MIDTATEGTPSSVLTNRSLSPLVLEQALHATDIMVVLTDPHEDDNPIVWVNDHFCEFTGYSRDEVLGRNCRFLQGEDRDQPATRQLRRAIETGESVHVLLRNYKKDGTPFDNDLYVSPVRDGEGRPLYFIGVQNDSTARVTAEREVANREREVHETAENERERFGMDLHDGLGQELAGVGLLLRTLSNRLEAESSEHAPAAARLLDLLEEAQQSAPNMARGLNPVDASAHGLGDALRTLCESVAGAHPELSVDARVVPVAFEDRREARHLYRIAQEAVSNAAKHAGATTVVLTLQCSAGALELTVTDDGAGIPEDVPSGALRGEDEAAETRAELARRGMGLYGMRYRADLIGARLTVGPAEGGGTVVRCVLPWEPDKEQGRGHRARHGERE